MKNYFDIFGVFVSYKIDEASLTSRYLQMQSRLHPDIQNDGGAESAYLNTAYNTLMNPVNRAKYFLELKGYAVDDTIAPEFAPEMFCLREKYAALDSLEDKKGFYQELNKKLSELIRKLYELEDNLEEFRKYFGLLYFINSFSERVKSDVDNWD